MKTNRRNFFQTMGAGAAGIGLASAFPLTTQAANTQKSAAKYDDQVLFVCWVPCRKPKDYSTKWYH